jgi:hypothetical protein
MCSTFERRKTWRYSVPKTISRKDENAPKHGFLCGPDIPCPYPRVDTDAADNVTLRGVPVNVSYCAVMGFENVLNGCLSA